MQTGFTLDERNVVERNPDNFLLLEVRPGKLDKNDEPELDENRSERFLFAAGDVDAGRIDPSTDRENLAFQPTPSIDHFFISPGLEGYDERATGNWVAEGSRAFLRQESALELDLTDTGLFVVNPASNAASRVLHADFALDGTGAAQQSTISLTLGKLNYVLNSCASCGDNGSILNLARL